MPFITTWENRGIYTEWTGHSSSAEMVEFLTATQANQQFDGAVYSIHDFSACESFSLDDDEMAFVAALDSAGALTNAKIKIAVVTRREDVRNMVTFYRNTLLSRYPVKIFETLHEARAWLS